MPYTLLLVTDAGVALYDYHAIRLEARPDSAAGERFSRFARQCSPGVWAVRSDSSSGIHATPRPGSRLHDAMPVRTLHSPAIDRAGLFPKPSSPGLYDQVRMHGAATLLTSPDGSEIYEACSAAVVGWDGERIVCAPKTRPRVWSTSEAAIRDHLPVREAPISSHSDAILLVNAVKGTCALPARYGRAFPPEIRREIDLLFSTLTRR